MAGDVIPESVPGDNDCFLSAISQSLTVIAFKDYFEKFLIDQPKKIQDKIFKIIEAIETLERVPSNFSFPTSFCCSILPPPPCAFLYSETIKQFLQLLLLII